MFASNFDEDTDISELEKLVIYWTSADSITSDGTLFTIDFLVSENAAVGQEISVGLTYDEDDICDHILQSVGANMTSGKIKTVAYTDDTEDTTYDYYINDAYVEGNESEETNFSASGNFDLTVCVQGEYDETLTPTMFTTCYAESGRLLFVKETDLTEAILTEGKTEVNIPESKTDIYKIKVFVWNTKTLMPLTSSYELFYK